VYTLGFLAARKLAAIALIERELHETNLHYLPHFLHGCNLFRAVNGFRMQSQFSQADGITGEQRRESGRR
jgi:hypothetical protein